MSVFGGPRGNGVCWRNRAEEHAFLRAVSLRALMRPESLPVVSSMMSVDAGSPSVESGKSGTETILIPDPSGEREGMYMV